MSCTIRKINRNEITDGNPQAGTPRMQRLKNLVNTGSWNGRNGINLIYWHPDAKATDGGFWVAWEDPDPLPPNVTIEP